MVCKLPDINTRCINHMAVVIVGLASFILRFLYRSQYELIIFFLGGSSAHCALTCLNNHGLQRATIPPGPHALPLPLYCLGSIITRWLRLSAFSVILGSRPCARHGGSRPHNNTRLPSWLLISVCEPSLLSALLITPLFFILHSSSPCRRHIMT